MKTFILLTTLSVISAHYIGPGLHSRHKRDASGALEIFTNNAQPIHADVKSETVHIDEIVTDIEKVTPPKDVYEVKSLRKNWPLTNRLDLIRSVTRIVTLTVLITSAVIEYYPLIQHLYSLIMII